MTDGQSLVVLDRLTVARIGGPVVLDDLSWTVRAGETWAVVGPVGSGKSTLAETLLGKHPVRSGSIAWPVVERLREGGRAIAYPGQVIRHVAFKEESRLFSYAGHYYQQRFEFADAEEPLTLDQFLQAGTTATDAEIRDAARRLGIEDRLGLSFIKLSNGQTRRARIARALLARPELLVLDDPFIGLDHAGRADVADLLGGLVRDGLPLVLICPRDAVPGWVTNVLDLKNPSPGPSPKRRGEEDGSAPPFPRTPPPAPPRNGEGSETPTLPPPSLLGKGAGGLGSSGGGLGSSIIDLRHVTVRHGGKVILDDVTWTVRAGERWAVVGPNGSGKTTLLSLLCGDHPQAYSNDVSLFGRRRGTGENIWEVKQRIGLVSPEFHLYFTEPLTAARAAATGFFDAVTARPTSPEQDATVADLFAAFGIAHLAARPFRQLSTGEQRLVLLVRALVKRPPLLVLDEPFQGLGDDLAAKARDWLDRHLTRDQTLLFVSHLPEEIPQTVTRRIRLGAGRVVEMI